jgi:hypothetical protein
MKQWNNGVLPFTPSGNGTKRFASNGVRARMLTKADLCFMIHKG